MTIVRRLLVLLTALTLADAAAGAYVPRLSVAHVPNGVEVSFRQTASDDASAVLSLHAAEQYSPSLGQAPGTTIGRVAAQIEVRALGGVVLTLDGTIVADDPANHVGNTCAAGLHQAVWVASLGVPGQQPIRIPIYVDDNVEAPLGAVRLQACLPSPDVPESQGGAPLGTKLLQATFTFERVFTPQGSGLFQWFGRFVPYVAGSPTPNVRGAVESRALIRTPGRVSLRGHRVARAGRQVAVLAGVVSEAGTGIAGAVVRIRGGGRTRTTKTGPSGGFFLPVPLKRTTTFTATVNVPDRDVTATGCVSAIWAPCVAASAAGFHASSSRVKVALPRPRSKR